MSRSATDARSASPANARVVLRRYRPRGSGLLYVLTTIVLVLGAINGQNNLLFLMFGLGVAGLALSGILSGTPLMGLAIARELPAEAAVGEPMLVRYRLRSAARWMPAFGLVIEEMPPPPTLRGAATHCEHLPARGARTAEARPTPTARGRLAFDRVRVTTAFPFGLANKSVTFSQPDHAWVRPALATDAPPVLRRVAGSENIGELLRRPRGGDEFFALREYVPGDSPRSVAWRSSARLGRLVVREWSERRSRRAWVVLDLSAQNARDAERVISVAAAIVKQGIDAGLEVGCAVADGPIVCQPRAGVAQFFRTLDALARLDAARPGPPAPLHSGARDTVVLVHAGGVSAGPASVDVRRLAAPGAPAA